MLFCCNVIELSVCCEIYISYSEDSECSSDLKSRLIIQVTCGTKLDVDTCEN